MKYAEPTLKGITTIKKVPLLIVVSDAFLLCLLLSFRTHLSCFPGFLKKEPGIYVRQLTCLYGFHPLLGSNKKRLKIDHPDYCGDEV